MSDRNLNPMGTTYNSFIEILKNLTIKYNYKADEFETLKTRQDSDMYLDCLNKRDTFDTYVDFTRQELIDVGITDNYIIDVATTGDTSVIPKNYREALLLNRRAAIIDTYEEQNNYYRFLNGYPDLEEYDYNFFYLDSEKEASYGMEDHVPIHLIQDHYNKKEPGRGDYYISILEGSGYIDKLIESHPDKPYLKYLGTSRISIKTAREAKNFQVIQLKAGNLNNTLYNQFLQVYEQCREYFIACIYIPSFRSFFEKYEDFIALCIMVMTIQQLTLKQMTLSIRREFFDIYAVKMLYEVYNLPYNLNIDEDTQSKIAQNLNMFIQNKATDGVLYNIAHALGFGDNFSIYKYYLSKEHKVDLYGVPIFKSTTRFNDDTGEVETIPDYEAMFDVYFHKAKLEDNGFVNTFDVALNNEDYYEIIQEDPYWIEDSKTYKKIWETEYNFVESKYLGFTIAYKMTEMMFDNLLLFKMMHNKEKDKELSGLVTTLPKITGEMEVPIFDVIIFLTCLLAAKHNLTGEIITIPNEVLHVLDYLHNTSGEDDKLVDTFGFNFDYFINMDGDSEKNLKRLYKLLGEEDAERLKKYISVLSIRSDTSNQEKIETINLIYENIKHLYRFINYQMSKTDDMETYQLLRRMYRAAFYVKEAKSIFTIIDNIGSTRTAYNYFEYLYYLNPKLYNTVFDFSPEDQYLEYLEDNGLLEKDYSYTQFITDANNGLIHLKYDKLINEVVENESAKEELIYFYMNHAISRLEIVIKNINYIYMLSDTTTPIENLLIKLCRFFKSYTTEIINLDNLIICDLKPVNMLRLFDKLHYMEKTIVPKEHLHFPYSDVVRLMEILHVGDDLKFGEKYLYEVWLHLKDKLSFSDEVAKITKPIFPKEHLYFLDSISSNSRVCTNDSLKFREHIVIKYNDDV